MCGKICPCNEPQGESALSKEVLGAMTEIERVFWSLLLETAEAEIEENEAADREAPFVPSEFLRRLIARAITKYNGMQYCQMVQLKEQFVFPDPAAKCSKKS
jgi:hypothetical protein